MKRLLTFFIISILVPCLSGFSAYAYDREPVRAEIEAEITLGGTAAIIPNVNSPVPEKTEINLKDGETGRFYIDFTEVGVYDYSVKEVPDDRNLNFDKTVYSIKVYVTDEDGTLTAAVIASKTGDESSQKLQRLVFVNTLPGEDESTSAPPEDNTVVPEGKNKNPQTGDDTKMELYFLLAILASAGLLAISIFYLIDTQKMIVECGINHEVYDSVSVNDTPVEGTLISGTDRKSYDSGWSSMSDRPVIVFDNHVNPESLRTLSFEKRSLTREDRS